jgi:hypothetical protein
MASRPGGKAMIVTTPDNALVQPFAVIVDAAHKHR